MQPLTIFGNSRLRRVRTDFALAREITQGLFDAEFYLARNEDVRASKMEPFAHYFFHGWKEGRNPSPAFDTQYYLQSNPEVRDAGINPLIHYALLGRKATRATHEPKDDVVNLPHIDKTQCNESLGLDYGTLIAFVAPLFDAPYYLQVNDDVRESGVDPLDHYLKYGWRENRDPSPLFDTQYYLEAHQDVRDAGVNPLVHFARYGRLEGRLATRPVDVKNTILRSVRSARGGSNLGSRQIAIPRLDGSAIVSRLIAGHRAQLSGLVVCLGCDEDTGILGNLHDCVAEEEVNFIRYGWRYLHVFPSKALPALANPDPADAFLVQLKLNGNFLGQASCADLIASLGQVNKHRMGCWCVVWNLTGFAPEHVEQIARSCNAGRMIFQMSDTRHICPHWPPPSLPADTPSAAKLDSATCPLCGGSLECQNQAKRMRDLFIATNPVLVAPSQATLNLCRGRDYFANAEAFVLPSHRLVLSAPIAPPTPRTKGIPLRVAFMGPPEYFAGWYTYSRLARQFAFDKRYEFIHVGTYPSGWHRSIRFVALPNQRDANRVIAEALTSAGIDVTVFWPLVPRTPNDTIGDALAAGTFVVTNRAYGNLWGPPSALAPEQAIELHSEQDLFEFFTNGTICEMAACSHRKRGASIRNGHSAEYILSHSIQLKAEKPLRFLALTETDGNGSI